MLLYVPLTLIRIEIGIQIHRIDFITIISDNCYTTGDIHPIEADIG